MNFRWVGRKVAPKVLLGCALLVSAATQAAPIISGQFTLQQDVDVLNGPQANDVVASVTFTAEDSGLFNGNGLSIFNVTRLELTDLTAQLGLDQDNDGFADNIDLIGNFLFEPPTGPSTPVGSSQIQAFFGPSMVFAGIDGDLQDTNPDRFVFFNLNGGVTLSTSTAGTLNVGTGFTDSFRQVPEPGVLALFGAGLVGFGVTRRRTRGG